METPEQTGCQAAFAQAQATLSSEQLGGAYLPPLPPGPPPMLGEWEPPPWGCAQSYAPDLPPVAAMLVREGNAWAALLQLHGHVAQAARGAAEASTEDYSESDLSAQREAAYVASLSQLAAQCDALHSEVVRVRGLRKARQHLHAEAIRAVLRAHSDETLALGTEVARGAAVALGTVTAEVRAATQALRGQIEQARALLMEVREASRVGIPAGATVVAGLKLADGSLDVKPVEQLLGAAYAHNGALNEESLAAALSSATVGPKPSGGRTFARRAAADRAVPRDAQTSAN